MTKRTLTLAALAICTVFVLAGCSKSTPDPTTPDTAAPETEEATTTAPPADGAIAITTSEYAFDIPTITAGEHELELVNEGEQVHMAVIVALDEGKTVDDAMAYIEENGTTGPPPDWAKQVAFGIAGPGETSPITAGSGDPADAGSMAGTTVDFVAGDYVALCFVPEGMMSTDDKPEKGAKSHADLGMIQGFTVA